jgi:hypothetical protein
MTVKTSLRLRAETCRTLDYTSISTSYTALGAPYGHAIRVAFIQNQTNAHLMFSFDGVNDHFIVPDESFILQDICLNQSINDGLYSAVGSQLYVKRLGPIGSGAVYATLFWGAP